MNTDETSSDARSEAPRRLRLETLTKRVIGVFYEVYDELGSGFLESVYHEAMGLGLRDAGIGAKREPPIEVFFRRRAVGHFRPDFLVEGSLILELKAVRALDDAHLAQLVNYLRATSVEVGLLLNFGPRAVVKRAVLDNALKRIRVHPCPSVVVPCSSNGHASPVANIRRAPDVLTGTPGRPARSMLP